jgi:hypothetical protein
MYSFGSWPAAQSSGTELLKILLRSRSGVAETKCFCHLMRVGMGTRRKVMADREGVTEWREDTHQKEREREREEREGESNRS